jgi:hypothetical protein
VQAPAWQVWRTSAAHDWKRTRTDDHLDFERVERGASSSGGCSQSKIHGTTRTYPSPTAATSRSALSQRVRPEARACLCMQRIAPTPPIFKPASVVPLGTVGFKKSKRSSQFATEKVISESFAKARAAGIRRVMITMSGSAIMLRKPLFKQLREEYTAKHFDPSLPFLQHDWITHLFTPSDLLLRAQSWNPHRQATHDR